MPLMNGDSSRSGSPDASMSGSRSNRLAEHHVDLLAGQVRAEAEVGSRRAEADVGVGIARGRRR